MTVPPLPHRHAPGTIRAALSYRDFRLLFMGSTLSTIGTWMQNFILPAYIDDRTGSASLVGLLIFVQLGPFLVLSLPGGMLADRVNRTRLVLFMQSTMLVLSLVLAALVATTAPLWSIFAAQLGIGIANTLNAPAFMASIPMMVDRRDLTGAVSLNSAMFNASRILGPSLAAALAALGLSIPQLFMVNAATFIAMIIPLVIITLPQPSQPPAARGWDHLLAGVAVARHRGVIRRALVSMTLFALISLPYVGLFPSVARLNFGISATSGSYKLLYITWGFGAFMGALSVGTWLARMDIRRLVPRGLIGAGVTLSIFAWLSDLRIGIVVAVGLGFTFFLIATAMSTIIQQNLDDTERATVMPLWFMSFGGMVPISNLIGGRLMDAVGARPVLFVGGVFALVLARYADLTRLDDSAFLAPPDDDHPYTPISIPRQV